MKTTVSLLACLALASLPLAGCAGTNLGTVPFTGATSIVSPAAVEFAAATAADKALAYQPAYAAEAYGLANAVNSLAGKRAPTPEELAATLRAFSSIPSVSTLEAKILEAYTRQYPNIVKAETALPYVAAFAQGVQQAAGAHLLPAQG